MAQSALNLQQYEDLVHAIDRVPRFATGVKSFPEMAKIYYEKIYSKALNENVPPIFEIFIAFVFSKFSLKEKLREYFDEEPPFELKEAVLSGSWSEGLVLFDPDSFDPPDVDFLCILKNISFTEEDQATGDLSIIDNSPFVNAYLSDIKSLELWQAYFIEAASEALEGKICQISSAKLKERLYDNYSKGDNFFTVSSEHCNPISDGPALKLSRVSAGSSSFGDNLLQTLLENLWRCSDLVLAIQCHGWPRNSLEWIRRERNWPSIEVVERITKEGFHIVAKSSCEGNFRLSFSWAEGILIASLNKMQHKTIRAFKAVIKLLLPCNPDQEEILESYHLKTIAFWHIEKSDPESWSKDNSANHLLQMLRELNQALRKKSLPMYFIRTYNLFSKVENLSQLEKLSDKVDEISKDISGLTNAVRMGASFHFYETHRDYFKAFFPKC
ncbi:uncharacterized protein LOC114524950 [Dendronephthya gigantea]|uniref:uncharacterized protein LOC114524950 n=1 Tax=Dendronephthya gigantea TaxID=151771 RepID=UPI00106D07EB|nr:uncharacterized protein LOC114524950 [Dendronephthya gigantea]